MSDQNLEEIKQKKSEWESRTLAPALERFRLKENPTRFYTPADVEGFDFLNDVGFPGEYPFTAGPYAVYPYAAGTKGGGIIQTAPGLRRAGRYSGYGTAEDTRDYYQRIAALGATAGPNLAMDLPTQCGYDSDSPLVRGEVGRVGVAIDTLRDMETIYEAFKGDRDLDKIASNFTINAPANIFVSMYLCLADQRGIPWRTLKGTPQNDILKEFVARGTYIFPAKPSMRLFRDSVVFMTEHVPGMNVTSIGGYHIREAGATREQDLAFSMAIGSAYLQCAVDAGLDIDQVAPKVTFNVFGGSMELFKEVAFHRAARRMWAKLLKEKFNSKNPRSWTIRMPAGAHIGPISTTKQRPLNNLTRSVVGGIANALSGYPPSLFPPFDEPLGLGWSLEAIQLAEDGGRILQYEAKVCDVVDPLAGSYYVEKLTAEIEEAALTEIEKIDGMGGAIAVVDNGYLAREIAKAAHERQKRIERGEDLVVGVNCFTDESEIEVTTNRAVALPYDPIKREEAEARQIARLTEVKRTRDNREVVRLLGELKEAAKNDEVNLFPHFIECSKAYVSEQEMCDVLREVFGEYEQTSIL